MHSTYELGLAILFLDRLGQPRDRMLVRKLALRLVAGQTSNGGWTYECPLLNAEQERDLLASLQWGGPNRPRAGLEGAPPFAGFAAGTGRSQGREILPPPLSNHAARQPFAETPSPSGERSDNSNTQFAMLGLWAAQRHGLPLEQPLARVAQRFGVSQNPAGGWAYRFQQPGIRLTPSMSCVGLLGLAVGRGLAEPVAASDSAIAKGFTVLASFVGKPLGWKRGQGGDRTAINLYFLWSLERTGVLYNRRTIDGKDWYRWGAELLLAAQAADGSWNAGGYPGAIAVTDSCFALLFLKRANLAKDLTKKLEFSAEDKKRDEHP